MFLGGASFCKDLLIYVYLIEIVPDRYRVYVASYKTSLLTIVSHFQLSFYFMYGGKDWKIGYAPSAVALFISIFLTLLIPESPKYLYAKKDWSQLHQALSSIARVNGKNVFITEESVQQDPSIKDSETKEDLLSQNKEAKDEEFSILRELRKRRVFVNLVAMII